LGFVAGECSERFQIARSLLKASQLAHPPAGSAHFHPNIDSSLLQFVLKGISMWFWWVLAVDGTKIICDQNRILLILQKFVFQ